MNIPHLGLFDLFKIEKYVLGSYTFHLYMKHQNYIDYFNKETNNYVVSYVFDYYSQTNTQFFKDEEKAYSYFENAKKKVKELLKDMNLTKLRELRKKTVKTIEENKVINDKIFAEIVQEASYFNKKPAKSDSVKIIDDIISFIEMQ